MTSKITKPKGISLLPIPETNLNIRTPKNPVKAKVIDKYSILHRSSPNFCTHIVLDLEGTGLEYKYRTGQSIGVAPQGRYSNPEFNYVHNKINGKIRLYSIASASWGDTWNGKTVSLCVKREMSESEESRELVFGTCSNYICDAKIGDELLITGPSGRFFLLPDNFQDNNYVFVATGTGIAPFRGMIIELLNQGFQNDVWLFFGAPFSTDLMYSDEFQELADEHPNFHYITAVSREQKK